MLNGFLEYHKIHCEILNCPSKRKFLGSKKDKQLLSHLEDNQDLIKLHYLINQLYVNALQKFPNIPRFRISHALFLFSKLKHRQHALTELIASESDRPSFTESFTIFRYK